MLMTKDIIESIFRNIPDAHQIIKPYIHITPVEYSASLSKLSGGQIYLKYENLQKTGSFKARGALYKTYKVKDYVKGVVAASAGNHAQGVAYASSIYNLKSIIVMPTKASVTKVVATRSYGAEVVLYGDLYDDAEKKALEIAKTKNYYFIHPFDDPDVITGQGTIGYELVQQLKELDAMVIPIGGGGLISGIAIYMKKTNPKIKIYGVEPENAPKMRESIRRGKPIEVQVKPTIADGLATKKPGKLTFKITKEFVDDIVTVTEAEIAEAVYYLLERGKVVVEGAGATTVATVLSNKLNLNKMKTLLLLSGGNIDLTAIYRILLRGLSRSGRIMSLRMYVPDVPGTLAKITSIIARHRGNILEVLHDRMDINSPAWYTMLKITIEVPSKESLEKIIRDLKNLNIILID